MCAAVASVALDDYVDKKYNQLLQGLIVLRSRYHQIAGKRVDLAAM